MTRSGLGCRPATRTALETIRSPPRAACGWRKVTVPPTPTPRSAAAFRARTRPPARWPADSDGVQTAPGGSTSARHVDRPARGCAVAPGTIGRACTCRPREGRAPARRPARSPGSRSRSDTVTRAGAERSSSAEALSRVARKVSSSPTVVTKVAMAAAMPSRVRATRRGVRSTLRSGICDTRGRGAAPSGAAA